LQQGAFSAQQALTLVLTAWLASQQGAFTSQQGAFSAQQALTLVLTAWVSLQHSGPPLGQSVQQSEFRQQSPPGTQVGLSQQGSSTQQAPLGQQSPVGQQEA